MGYYTEFKSKRIKLRKDFPKELVNLIYNCETKEESKLNNLPKHKFFTLDRWILIFQFTNDVPSKLENDGKNYYITIDAYINYGREEIQEFAKWITPYISGHKPKEYIGWIKSEGEYEKTNVYINRK